MGKAHDKNNNYHSLRSFGRAEDTHPFYGRYAFRPTMKSIITSLLCALSFTCFGIESEGFRTQILEPTGGKIEVPKEWHYNERHSGQSYTWILSKEDLEKGPYITGVRIQSIMGVEEKTGKTPEIFLREFVESKKEEVQVISQCKAQDQGIFTRICLETIEPAAQHGEGKKFRIQYSLFWGNGIDLAVVMIAGTLEELWPENKEIFNSMQGFEFIDMKRFE